MKRLAEGLGGLYAVGIALIGLVLGGAAVVFAWYFGDTSSSMSEVARFLPVSDALGYHGCATSLAAAGKWDESFGVDWCARRVLYATMLASLLSVTAFSSQLTLVLQGSLVGLAIAVFSLQARAIVGISGALMAAAILSVFAWEFTVGLFMTEVAGFALGLFGLTLLMSFGETRRVPLLFAGTAVLSVALMARAGAMFVLPGIVIWVLLALGGNSPRRHLALLTASALGVAFGPLLQFAVAALLGADPSHTGGNFSTSLYGLSTGSRDWTEAYRQFDTDFKLGERTAFQRVYAAAFQNISENPFIFASALLKAARIYWFSLFTFGVIEYLNPVLTALAALGVMRCLVALRLPWASLFLILGAAEAFTAPLIMDSGGIRVFAVTAPIRILFCALGLHFIGERVARMRHPAGGPEQRPISYWGTTLAAMTASALVLLMMLAPATPLGRLSYVQAVPAVGCSTGLIEVVSRVGRESQTLTISDRATSVESLQPFRLGRQRLLNDDELEMSWLGPYLLNLKPPLTIVRAVDRSVGATGAIKHLAFVGELLPTDLPMSLCVDPIEHLDFANVNHYFIKSVRRSDVR